MRRLAFALSALAIAAALAPAAEAETSTFTSERSCVRGNSGANICTTTTETADSFSVRECSHFRGKMECTTTERDKATPEPTYEPQHFSNGRTVTIMRGMQQ